MAPGDDCRLPVWERQKKGATQWHTRSECSRWNLDTRIAPALGIVSFHCGMTSPNFDVRFWMERRCDKLFNLILKYRCIIIEFYYILILKSAHRINFLFCCANDFVNLLNFNCILDSAPLQFFILYSKLTCNSEYELIDYKSLWLIWCIIQKLKTNISDQNFDAIKFFYLIVFLFCTAMLLSLKFVNVFLSLN